MRATIKCDSHIAINPAQVVTHEAECGVPTMSDGLPGAPSIFIFSIFAACQDCNSSRGILKHLAGHNIWLVDRAQMDRGKHIAISLQNQEDLKLVIKSSDCHELDIFKSFKMHFFILNLTLRVEEGLFFLPSYLICFR